MFSKKEVKIFFLIVGIIFLFFSILIIIELNKSKNNEAIGSGNSESQYHYQTAIDYYNDKNWGLAKINFERISTEDENYIKAQELLKECYLHLDSIYFGKGLDAYNNKKWVEARENFGLVSSNFKNFLSVEKYLTDSKKKAEEYEQQQITKSQELQKAEEQKFLNSKAGKIWQFCQKKNAVVTKSDCIKASENQIWIGMNIWLLVARRGNPSSVNPSNYGSGTQYQYCWWDYTPSCFYDENNDWLIEAYN